jgi:hypothetical protein
MSHACIPAPPPPPFPLPCSSPRVARLVRATLGELPGSHSRPKMSPSFKNEVRERDTHAHTHPSHSQTSRLLSTSLSLGTPSPAPPSVCKALLSSSFRSSSLTTPTPFTSFPLALDLSAILNNSPSSKKEHRWYPYRFSCLDLKHYHW